jgi:V-type H+-transporting ATPase subunit a
MIPAESAHAAVAALGDLGLLQFKDLNAGKAAFQRAYASAVKRCDELARKLRFFKEQVDKAGLPIAAPMPLGSPGGSLLGGVGAPKHGLHGGGGGPGDHQQHHHGPLDELEARLDELETETIEINGNAERLARSYAELAELQLVLEKAGSFFERARLDAAAEGNGGGAGGNIGGIGGSAGGLGADRAYSVPEAMDAPLLESALGGPSVGTGLGAIGGGTYNSQGGPGRLGFVAGLIQQEKLVAFERLLFRATRGNVFLRTAPVGSVSDPATGDKQEKHVFVVFHAGERARAKVLRICEAFNANRYPFPEEPSRQRQMHGEVTARLRELHTTIEAGDRHREAVLRSIAQSLATWQRAVRREKLVHHTLNKFSVDASSKVLVGEAWCPVAARARVHDALRAAAEGSATGGHVQAILQPIPASSAAAKAGGAPPTYFRTDDFTGCFQMMVDAYGMARYREANPAVFTIVTFPFLFAIMFGDLGHGLLMLAFALYLVLNEAKFKRQPLDEIFGMAFGGRYCILLMGIFSLFTGLLYNEFFSMPMTLFFGPSRAKCVVVGGGAGGGAASSPFEVRADVTDLRACADLPGGTVAFPPGTAPYPMGVDPVWHGTKSELPFLNSVKMKMSIVLGIVHMNLGILVSLCNQLHFRDALSVVFEFVPQVIFLNALFGYLSLAIVYKWISGKTTDLYGIMIGMFLSPGTIKPSWRLYGGQAGVQVLLLLLALVAVPWMLLPKPLILKKRAEAAMAARGRGGGGGGSGGHHHDDEEGQSLVGGLASSSGANGGGGGGGGAAAAGADDHGGGGGHDDHGDPGNFNFGDVFVHSMIHTIEFVLGAVSNTASYLRLWALSLAHSQLSVSCKPSASLRCAPSGCAAARSEDAYAPPPPPPPLTLLPPHNPNNPRPSSTTAFSWAASSPAAPWRW